MIPLIPVSSQLKINEGSCRNYTRILDENSEYTDWFELYNASQDTVNLENWTVSDDFSEVAKWTFSPVRFSPGSHMLIFASGKDRHVYRKTQKWESPVLPTDTFRYIIPVSGTPDTWKTIGFNDTDWLSGTAGFGYGDEDDNTTVPDGTRVIYIRKSFTIPDTASITDVLLHVDYDDGFVAYLNGHELCRSNITGVPAWVSYSSGLHEAAMYKDALPEKFSIDRSYLSAIWNQGENVLAIEVHNATGTSSDMSLIPYLSFAIAGEGSHYPPTPVWLSRSLEKNLHTNFKLSSEGETVYLFDPGQSLIDSLCIERTALDYSVGRATDGSDTLSIFIRPTPGESNNTSVPYTNGYETTPVFSYPAGFYENSIEISITGSSPATVIRYTINGSEPTSRSDIYDETPIIMNKTTTLKARCFSTGDKLPGRTVTATYFIHENFTLPVLSVSTDTENLYGTTGIFTNWAESWNKPCFVEFFDSAGTLAFSQEAGIQVDGGAGGSRSRPQHSFRIEPGNGTLGEGDLEYTLLPDRPHREKYDSFFLRNGSNLYLAYPFKDASLVRSLGKGTYNFYPEFRPVTVFINGNFFGIYGLREKLNRNYLESNYGMDTEGFNLVGGSVFEKTPLKAIVGTTDQFEADAEYFARLNPYAKTYLQEAGKIIDLNNYTDYIIAENWNGNTDWPHNNIKAFRCKGTDYKWFFLLYDLELALEPKGWTNSTFDHFDYIMNKGTSLPYTAFWNRLIKNDDYKIYFINRYADLMNTRYRYEITSDVEDRIYQSVLPEMPKEYERWGTREVPSHMNVFSSNHDILSGELRKRSIYIRNQLQNHFNLEKQVHIYLDAIPHGSGKIKISTVIPDEYPWDGYYFSDIPITIEAIPYPGYRFSGWEENLYIDDPSSSSFTVEISHPYINFVATFEQGETGYDGITISEVNYKNGNSFGIKDWFEILNATDTAIALDGWYFTDDDSTHIYYFEPGTRLQANDRLVVARNLDNFAINYPGVNNITGGFDFGLGNPSDEITLFDEKGRQVVSLKYSDTYPWPLYDSEDGRTLELIDPSGNLNDPANWFAGCIKGSPGEIWTRCDPFPGSEFPDNSATEENSYLKAFPNPFQDRIILEFLLIREEERLTVQTYNMLGRLIDEMITPALPSGRHRVKLNLSGLDPNQLYFIQVSGNHFQQTVKIMKQ